MNVNELMVRDVATCSVWDDLNRAAQLMWENDCGIVPVVEGDDRLIGVISDRDAFMAAYTKGLPLGAIRVGDVMSRELSACRPEDDVGDLITSMRTHRVRRLPVVDEQGRLVGIVSLSDVARRAAFERGGAGKGLRLESVAEALAAICEPWSGGSDEDVVSGLVGASRRGVARDRRG